MRKLLTISFLLFMGTAVGQDIHFSQFFSSPLNLNPALTGQFDADYRFVANQRQQWRSVTNNPYSTFAVSADAYEPLEKQNIGAGVSFLYDVAGLSRFKTAKLNFSGSYWKPVSTDSVHSVSGGAQFGFTHRSITYDELAFDAQYNGSSYDASLSNGENFQRDSRFYLNFNVGAVYYYRPEERMWASAGLAYMNIPGAKQSFFNDDGITLDSRVVLSLEGQYPVADDWDILPSIFVQAQGTYRELIFGSRGKYTLVNQNNVYRAFYAGLFYRNRDAGYFMLGMDYDQWHVGVSYDVNISNLSPASNNRGGFEIAVIYKLSTFKEKRIIHRICPDYI